MIIALQKTVERHQPFFFNLLKNNKTLYTSIVSDFSQFEILSGIESKTDDMSILNEIAYLSTFVFINQLLFYHLLIHEKKIVEDLNLVELREDLTLEQIETLFDEVKRNTYHPIYSIGIIENFKGKRTLSEAQVVVKDCIREISAIFPEKISQDLMGLVYHNLIPRKIRKKLAAFFTHPSAAEILCSSLITRGNQTVFDPACGSGMILSAAYRRKLNLLSSQEKKGKNHLHFQSIEEEIMGVDIMPFSVHLTAMNLYIQSPYSKLEEIRVGIDDSLRLNPNSEVGGKLDISHIELNKERRFKSFKIGKVDLIIMNPPFTKKRLLSKQMKEAISTKWWGNIGSFHYWGHFLLNSLPFLKENGSIGAILPLGSIALKDGMKILKEIELKGFSHSIPNH